MTMPALARRLRVRYATAGVGIGPEQAHVGAGGDQARFERGFEHVARDARVLADDDGRLARAAGEHRAGGAAELEHELGRDRPFADAAADAVGAEVFAIAHAGSFPVRVLVCRSGRWP